jgi:hypothetical protein
MTQSSRRTFREPDADPLVGAPPPDRPHYATGMLLDAEDFLDEQTYHRGRLARALAFLSGGGTLAGLRVIHRSRSSIPPVEEEIRVEPGIAIDRIGRLIELPRPACLRLQRWWDGWISSDADTIRQASYTEISPLLSRRARAEAGTDDRAPLPDRALIADVYLRFIACPRGFTPAFASGPYDALNAVATARLRDAYELLLLPRPGLDAATPGLPSGPPSPPPDADPATRSALLQDAVLANWPVRGRAGAPEALEPLSEHADGVDPTAHFLARLALPVTGDNPPARAGGGVLVDNGARRFAASTQLLQRLIGL